jgi:GDP-L-fucose synthase
MGHIYPKLAAQPMQETALLTGTLEETNEPYAISIGSGLAFCIWAKSDN